MCGRIYPPISDQSATSKSCTHSFSGDIPSATGRRSRIKASGPACPFVLSSSPPSSHTVTVPVVVTAAQRTLASDTALLRFATQVKRSRLGSRQELVTQNRTWKATPDSEVQKAAKPGNGLSPRPRIRLLVGTLVVGNDKQNNPRAVGVLENASLIESEYPEKYRYPTSSLKKLTAQLLVVSELTIK